MALQEIVTGELIKWSDKGDDKIAVKGILKNREEKDTSNGVGYLYEVRTKEGVVPFFAPSMLEKKLKEVPVGDVVSIVQQPTTQTKVGNDLKNFSVAHGPANEENLSSVGLEATLAEVDEVEEDEIPR